MINLVVLEGRLTKDVEATSTPSGKLVAKFSIAVNRGKDKTGKDLGADFINCVAWDNNATFVSNWFHKGDGITVIGKIATRSYDDTSGRKVFVTEVNADRVTFPEGKKSEVVEAPKVEVVEPFNIGRDDLPF